MIANAVAFCCGNVCTFISEALHLQCVFHGIDLRLTGLVVGRQSIFFCIISNAMSNIIRAGVTVSANFPAAHPCHRLIFSLFLVLAI